MKIVITGALGHIGSRLIHSLRPGEFSEVVLLDNLTTQRYCSLFNLPDGVRFRFIEGDIREVDLADLLGGAHAVIHLAAITNAAGSFEMVEEVEQVNISGTFRVAQACLKTGTRLLFLSTTSVYGTQENEVDEFCGANQLRPQSPYAESKLKSEALLTQMRKEEGLDFVACRFGTIYGVSPGMRFHTAVNKFAWQACVGEPVTVWTTALHQRRPYLDVHDAAESLKFILRQDLFNGNVYNVLTENLTVSQVIDALKTYVPELQIKTVETRIMNQLSYTVRNKRFRECGFEFRGDYRNALKETVAALRNIRHAKSAL